MQMDANDPNRADDALATALGRFEQLTIVLPQGGLNVYAPPFVPQEVKRCTYCLGVWPGCERAPRTACRVNERR